MMDEIGHELIAREALSRSLEPAFGWRAKCAIRAREWGCANERGPRRTSICRFPPTYCRSFGGLRWAQYGEAVEFLEGPAAGRTFAFAAEIAAFLEGLQEPGRVAPRLWVCLASSLPDRSGGSRGPAWGGLAPIASSGSRRPFVSWPVHCATPGPCAHGSAARLPAPPTRRAGRAARDPYGGSWVPQMVLSHRQRGVMDQAEEPGLLQRTFEELVMAHGGSS